MSSVTVGKVSTFGNGLWDQSGQIWQMLLDARSGAFPLSVATSPSGTAPDGVQIGKVSSFGMGVEDYASQIWQMLIDARTGAVPFVVTGLTPPDPLAGITFLLRLQNKYGTSNVPYQVYTNIAGTTPATTAGDKELVWKDNLSTSGISANQAFSASAPTLQFLGGVPQNVFNGTSSTMGLSSPVVLTGDFDIYAVVVRTTSTMTIPLGSSSQFTQIGIRSNNFALAADDSGNTAFGSYTGSTTGMIGLRYTRIGLVTTFEATGQSSSILGNGILSGTLTLNTVGSDQSDLTTGNVNAVLVTTDTTKSATIKTYLNGLYGGLFP